ncbi:MAG TPA: aminotransferase class I/II-fold pyridoxal phosphate-dependent enzyme [Desulfobacteraceae bacterium]|nr:aminotransferase class I/II-fold pyridoxal phosphate-dependent enzyme [Desulfobacteraceae bacterium]
MGYFNNVDRQFLKTRATLKWGKWNDDIISLTVADMDFPAPDAIKNAVIEAVNEDRTPYSAYAGDPDVLEAVCEKLNRANKIPAKPEDVHMIPGTMFAIFLACYYALEPGCEAVICPSPVYPPFLENIENAGGTSVHCSVDLNSGNTLDLEDLQRRITPKTRIIMLSNPNNPCGLVLTRRELEGIARIAQDHDLLIFSDELYEDMIFEGEHISIASLESDLFERTITAFGFSKAYGIPGFRIAYITCRGKHMAAIKKLLHGMIVHADTLAQAAAKAALLHGGSWLSDFMAHLKKMREYTVQRLNSIEGIKCPLPRATPFVFPDVGRFGVSGDRLAQILVEEAGVAVYGGAAYGPAGKNRIRINFATAKPVLEEAMDRIQARLALPLTPE